MADVSGGSAGGASKALPDSEQVLDAVIRETYAAAARAAAEGKSPPSSCCGPGEICLTDAGGTPVFGEVNYDDRDRAAASGALATSLGCGVPTAVAELSGGETVLDLGSGAGGDVLISARRVGPAGRVIGLDMTDEMVAIARANAARAGVDNVEFLTGRIEDIPLPDDSVDVVISNCVINLSSDKSRVLREVARVLRPGGRFAVSDVIADDDMDPETRRDMAAWTGCIAGALTRAEFGAALAAAGLERAEIRETHRVHRSASAAIVSATKPIAISL